MQGKCTLKDTQSKPQSEKMLWSPIEAFYGLDLHNVLEKALWPNYIMPNLSLNQRKPVQKSPYSVLCGLLSCLIFSPFIFLYLFFSLPSSSFPHQLNFSLSPLMSLVLLSVMVSLSNVLFLWMCPSLRAVRLNRQKGVWKENRLTMDRGRMHLIQGRTIFLFLCTIQNHFSFPAFSPSFLGRICD